MSSQISRTLIIAGSSRSEPEQTCWVSNAPTQFETRRKKTIKNKKKNLDFILPPKFSNIRRQNKNAYFNNRLSYIKELVNSKR